MNGWTLALCSGDDVPCFLYIIHGTVFFNNSLDVNVLPALRRNQRIDWANAKDAASESRTPLDGGATSQEPSFSRIGGVSDLS